MRITLDDTKIEDYRRFLSVRNLPTFQFRGTTAIVPDEYARLIGAVPPRSKAISYCPHERAFDYQSAITDICIRRKKFSVFADCGLGKSLILLEYARHVASVLPRGMAVLIVSPIMVIHQTLSECAAFYGDSLSIERVPSGEVDDWLRNGTGRIGITNYEAFSRDVGRGRLGCLILDESSMLKSHYGKWGTSLVRLGRGVEWKLALTGTPAPNDRIEYANHAVLMDAFPSVNSFLARYFINRGQTDNRWEIKPHAINAFYRDLSHWCIFLTNPATYGWQDNTATLPPIHTHVHDVPLNETQRKLAQSRTGDLFTHELGGISDRTRLATIGKGFVGGERIDSAKPRFIRGMIESWPDESTLVWCLYNEEQKILEEAMPDAASITGETPLHDRESIIARFKSGEIRTLITKPKILGFGLNLQVATRQVFSGLQDSYESFYQAVKRSNRYGSTKPLNVHIPVTELERPMIETVLSKAKRVQQDAEEVERIFKNAAPFWK